MALSAYVPRAGYRSLSGGNYYISEFGYLSVAGAPPFKPGVANLLLFGRNLDRARLRGIRT